MPMDRRAATAIRTSAANGARRPAVPPQKHLTNKSKGGGGSIVVKLLFLLVVAGAGLFGIKQYKAYKARPKPPPAPAPAAIKELPQEPEEIVAKPKTNAAPRKVAQKRRKLTMEELIQREVEREQVADRKSREPEMSPEEYMKLRAERAARLQKRLEDAEAARRSVADQIAAARKDAAVAALPGAAGFKFGEPFKGVASVWGPILPGSKVEDTGIAHAIYGKPVAEPVGTLGKSPLVWVTPKTERIFRIEFFRPLKVKPPKQLHDDETAKLVEAMKALVKRDPFALKAADPKVRGAEYVFPAGDTTLTVGEFGDDLKVVFESETVKLEAKKEFDDMRAAKLADTSEDDLLVSKRYPQGPAVSYRGLISRFRDMTPLAFCGLEFGREPAEAECIVDPKNGEKGYFLDYVRAKCPIFKGFGVGKADIDPWRRGLFAVTLYNSEGGDGGVYDLEFYKSVKASLDRQYLVTPEERKGVGEMHELVYQKGDVQIVFGPDRNGGFYLKATNQALADVAKVEPARPKSKKGRGRK